MADLSAGDRVQLNEEFFADVSISLAARLRELRGRIIEFEQYGSVVMAKVKWDNGTTGKVIANSLSKIESGLILPPPDAIQ